MKWNRDQLISAFNLYCRTPFGRFHQRNPDIISLAGKMGRTPSAVAMKMSNFASFDPAHQARKIKGLANASRADREIWDEFNGNPERVAFESQQVISRLAPQLMTSREPREAQIITSGPTEALRSVRVRLVQDFFRKAVLASYEERCAMCELAIPAMLNASHIIPWSKDERRRGDPKNGLALCAFHDRAFDRGLITVAENDAIVLSRRMSVATRNKMHIAALLELKGKKLKMPHRFTPDPAALAYHRREIFQP